jgi:hypothetical protein
VPFENLRARSSWWLRLSKPPFSESRVAEALEATAPHAYPEPFENLRARSSRWLRPSKPPFTEFPVAEALEATVLGVSGG